MVPSLLKLCEGSADSTGMKRRELVAILPFAMARAEAKYVGRWRSVETSRGGIGGVFEFDMTGKVRYSSAALVEAVYQWQGSVLTWNGKAAGIGWHPDGRMQLNFGNGVIQDYTRVGAKAEGIVGEWKGMKQMSEVRVPTTFVFREDGKSLMVVWLKTLVGKLNGNRAVLAGGKGYVVREEGEALAIQADGGDPYRYVRI